MYSIVALHSSQEEWSGELSFKTLNNFISNVIFEIHVLRRGRELFISWVTENKTYYVISWFFLMVCSPIMSLLPKTPIISLYHYLLVSLLYLHNVYRKVRSFHVLHIYVFIIRLIWGETKGITTQQHLGNFMSIARCSLRICLSCPFESRDMCLKYIKFAIKTYYKGII